MKRKLSFAAIMGIITTGIISLAVMLINTNLMGIKLMAAWLKSWAVAYIIVIPCILIFSPIVERILNKIYK